MAKGDPDIELRFLAAPTDAASFGGTVQAGRVLEWIDRAGYAVAVGWAGGYCVTAYVGNVHFDEPIRPGDLIEVKAKIAMTGRSTMHVHAVVSSGRPEGGALKVACDCLMIFVALGEDRRPREVPDWVPKTDAEKSLAEVVRQRIDLRKSIEQAMAEQTFTAEGTAPAQTLRFLARPTDSNWGGNAHGGTVMGWMDEAAYVVAAGWSQQPCVAVYTGGIRFYKPIHIGDVVEVEARLLATGTSSMHISVHVRSGDPAHPDLQLTTHSMIIFCALDAAGRPSPVPSWNPSSAEDHRLAQHTLALARLRAQVPPIDRG